MHVVTFVHVPVARGSWMPPRRSSRELLPADWGAIGVRVAERGPGWGTLVWCGWGLHRTPASGTRCGGQAHLVAAHCDRRDCHLTGGACITQLVGEPDQGRRGVAVGGRLKGSMTTCRGRRAAGDCRSHHGGWLLTGSTLQQIYRNAHVFSEVIYVRGPSWPLYLGAKFSYHPCLPWRARLPCNRVGRHESHLAKLPDNWQHGASGGT